MKNTFCEVKLFQVKPDKIDDFEKLIIIIAEEQKQQKGRIDVKLEFPSICCHYATFIDT